MSTAITDRKRSSRQCQRTFTLLECARGYWGQLSEPEKGGFPIPPHLDATRSTVARPQNPPSRRLAICAEQPYSAPSGVGSLSARISTLRAAGPDDQLQQQLRAVPVSRKAHSVMILNALDAGTCRSTERQECQGWLTSRTTARPSAVLERGRPGEVYNVAARTSSRTSKWFGPSVDPGRTATEAFGFVCDQIAFVRIAGTRPPLRDRPRKIERKSDGNRPRRSPPESGRPSSVLTEQAWVEHVRDGSYAQWVDRQTARPRDA